MSVIYDELIDTSAMESLRINLADFPSFQDANLKFTVEASGSLDGGQTFVYTSTTTFRGAARSKDGSFAYKEYPTSIERGGEVQKFTTAHVVVTEEPWP